MQLRGELLDREGRPRGIGEGIEIAAEINVAGAYIKGLALEDLGQGHQRPELDGCRRALGEITHEADADGLAVEALCDGGDGLAADLLFPFCGCIQLPGLVEDEVAFPGDIGGGRIGGMDNDVAP